MKVAIYTSVSPNVAEIASITTPVKAEYCLRHGYDLVVVNEPYEQAVACKTLWSLLYHQEWRAIWALDADCLITNLTVPIHSLPCLGPHMTACEEGIVAWNKINCGSTFWRCTEQSTNLLAEIASESPRWRHLPCGWQSLVADDPRVTVAPLRSFNSCEWNRPAGGDGDPGCHWRTGDLVYHPCGVFPLGERPAYLRRRLEEVVR